MNKLIETFLTSIAAILIYKLLTAVVNYYRYKEDDIDIPPQDFNQCDHIHLNAEVSD